MACELVRVGILKLEDDSYKFPEYTGVVVLSADMLLVIHSNAFTLRLHSCHSGHLLATSDKLQARPYDVCVVDRRGCEIAVTLGNAKVEILLVESTCQSAAIKRVRTLDVKGEFDYCHGVTALRLGNKLVVSGGKEDKDAQGDWICWGLVSHFDGHVGTVHKICKSGGSSYGSSSYLATSTDDSVVYISCWTGPYYPKNNGVYAFDFMSEKFKFKYCSRDLAFPKGISVDRRGFIYVCNWDPPCIHQLTETLELVTIHRNGIPSEPLAMDWEEKQEELYMTRMRSKEVWRICPQWSDEEVFLIKNPRQESSSSSGENFLVLGQPKVTSDEEVVHLWAKENGIHARALDELLKAGFTSLKALQLLEPNDLVDTMIPLGQKKLIVESVKELIKKGNTQVQSIQLEDMNTLLVLDSQNDRQSRTQQESDTRMNLAASVYHQPLTVFSLGIENQHTRVMSDTRCIHQVAPPDCASVGPSGALNTQVLEHVGPLQSSLHNEMETLSWKDPQNNPQSAASGADSLPDVNQPKTQKKWRFWQRTKKRRERFRQVICERYFRDIRTYLSDKPTRFHLVNEDFAIENSIIDSRLEDLKRKIVQLASQQSYWGEEIPTRWIPLEQELMRLKAAGIKVIPLSFLENMNQAGAVPIATEELDLFLRFLHDVGTILYFSIALLKDKIVLDPQWMIDALKSLITAEMFVLRSAPAVAEKWLVFKTSGKLSPELIDAIWTKEHNPNLHDNKEHILLLMEHLNIIAKPRCYSEDGSEIKVENYFLAPCMLKETTPREVISPEPKLDTESSSVLCYIFIGKVLPPPIFHRLVASCVSHWPIAKKKSEDLIFWGCCVFDIDLFHRLTVFFRGYIIFVQVTRIGKTEKTPSFKVCIEVREFITMTLSSVIGYLGQSLQFKLAIQCPTSDGYSVDSLIPIADLQENVEVPCHFHDDSHVIMSHDVLKFWFQDEEHSDDGSSAVLIPPPPTGDTDRFMRLTYLLVDVGSRVLRRLLCHHTVTPTCSLDQYLAKNRSAINGLLKRKVLHQSQMDILFPPNGGNTNIEDYDVTLLSALFNNIVPSLSQQEEGMIKCLRENRNKLYGHAKSCKMNAMEYQTCWNSISSTMTTLSRQCGDPNFENEISREIQQIQVSAIPTGSYRDILKTWFSTIETVKGSLETVKGSLEGALQSLQSRVEALEVKQTAEDSEGK